VNIDNLCGHSGKLRGGSSKKTCAEGKEAEFTEHYKGTDESKHAPSNSSFPDITKVRLLATNDVCLMSAPLLLVQQFSNQQLYLISHEVQYIMPRKFPYFLPL
jgi:hypothetical protein